MGEKIMDKFTNRKKRIEFIEVFHKYGLDRLDTPMGEQIGVKIEDTYPRWVKGSDVYYYFRALGLAYKQPIRTIMRIPKPQPSKYRTVKKGYVGIKTPSHPDGKWDW